jgi:hypothetical protein
LMGMPQAVISPLSSVHGMYLAIGLVDSVRVTWQVGTHLKTTSLGNASPGWRAVIMSNWNRELLKKVRKSKVKLKLGKDKGTKQCGAPEVM